MLHYFFSFSQITSFWWNNCSFPVIYIYKKVYFLLFVADLFWFLHDLTRMLQRVESICYLFVGRIYCCFFTFYQLRRMNIWSATIWICFMTFTIYPCVRFFWDYFWCLSTLFMMGFSKAANGWRKWWNLSWNLSSTLPKEDLENT